MTSLPTKYRLPFVAALAALGLATASAPAQTWTNAAGGTFENAANWTALPVSGPTTALTFGAAGISSATYTATNNTANFTLNSLTFNNLTPSTVTIAGSALNNLNFASPAAGTPQPTIVVSGTGTDIITAPVNITAPSPTTNVDFGIGLTMSGNGNLTFAGAIGGSVANGAAANADVGITAGGAGTGTLTFSGGGSTGFLRFNNRNVAFTGGIYNLAAAGNDTPSTAVPNPPPSSPLIFAQNATDNVNVTISGGTVINSFDNIYFANQPGSVSNALITGAGTVVNAGFGNPAAISGRFGPGNKGTGNVTISAGAVVNCFFLFQSRLSGSDSLVIVDGPGSLLFSRTQITPAIGNSGQFSIGNQSTGVFTVRNGGEARGRNFVLGNTALDAAADTGLGNATLNVTGAGSVVNAGGPIAATNVGDLVPGNMTVGSAGNGRLNILLGGVVNVNNDGGAVPAGGNLFTATNSAINTGLTGRIDISGTNSRLNIANQFSLGGGGGAGVAGASALNITAAGGLTVGGTAIFGQSATPTPTTTGSTTIIDGTGSFLNVTGQIQLNEGLISFSIRGGGTATSVGTAFVGSSTIPGGSVAFDITGAGSTLTSPALLIGGQGTTPGLNNAVVNVNAGGVANTTNALTIFGLGQLNVNGGTVNAGSLADGVTGASVGNTLLAAGAVLNLTGVGNGSYSGIISGAGRVAFPATATTANAQTFAGPNTYTGGTTLNAGVLLVTNAAGSSGTGTGLVTVSGTGTAANSGTLAGTGFITGPVSILSGGTLSAGTGVAPTITGILTLSGATTLAAGGTVDLLISGTTNAPVAGTDTDQIALLSPGTIALGLSRLVITANNAALDATTSVTIITGPAGSVSGTFGSLPNNTRFVIPNTAGVPGVSDFYLTTITYSPTSVVLSNFAPVPEPTSVLAACAAGAGLVGWSRRRRAKAAI